MAIETLESINIGGVKVNEGDTLVFSYVKKNGEEKDYAIEANGLTKSHIYGPKLGTDGLRSFIVSNMSNIRKVN